MSSYLQIAEEVLRLARRPLSARAILKQAYSIEIAPYHLYGKTQHKTLQARLSEDILQRREHSIFFRTKPGQFFLREFLTDTSIPAEYRQPIVARRRTRDLFLGPALSVSYRYAARLLQSGQFAEADLVEKIANSGCYRYIDPKKKDDDDVLLWAVSALTRPGKMLSYRAGRYRDDRDHFVHKRSIAFSTLVSEENHTLFDTQSLGVLDSALFAAAVDLDIPLPEAFSAGATFDHFIRFFAWQPEAEMNNSLLAFVEVRAPDWFEPTASRLSLNDLCWLDMSSPPNNWDDFDPPSQTILSYYFPRAEMHG
ncbi:MULTISPECIES: winged helix-turn-helix domain-containing protein [Rhizobium/Agrobacterium group]|uniref:winged helix-turn-helix domain-containing protein n=1 Tax=Rhizobium/Agrobacterium group TaxID=227290 RepID=UPI00230180B0|nr:MULTISPECIES: winged helix-turn-helix domain-containing protein [Rhizobium/Agrobacterium group]MDA5635432.1 winged helix-turn-helix domain-containing protein [Agrobacterium sp. ST15.16.024]MDF1890363.1 winged helix-turn-helix domain-containing protein [Rhizobium rhizogenes]